MKNIILNFKGHEFWDIFLEGIQNMKYLALKLCAVSCGMYLAHAFCKDIMKGNGTKKERQQAFLKRIIPTGSPLLLLMVVCFFWNKIIYPFYYGIHWLTDYAMVDIYGPIFNKIDDIAKLSKIVEMIQAQNMFLVIAIFFGPIALLIFAGYFPILNYIAKKWAKINLGIFLWKLLFVVLVPCIIAIAKTNILNSFFDLSLMAFAIVSFFYSFRISQYVGYMLLPFLVKWVNKYNEYILDKLTHTKEEFVDNYEPIFEEEIVED